MFFWLFFAILLAIVLALCSSKMESEIQLIPHQHQHQIVLSLRTFWGLVRLNYASPMLDVRFFEQWVLQKQATSEKNNPLPQPHRFLELYLKLQYFRLHMLHFSKWFRTTVKKIQCKQFVWITQFGLQEAPQTAISAGFLCMLQNLLSQLLFHRLTLNCNPHVQVVPRYEEYTFSSRIHLLLTLKWISLLRMGVYFFVLLLRSKHRLRLWMILRSVTSRS